MSRSSLQNVLSLPDAAQSWNYDLFLPTIPGSSNTRDLTYKCMTTDMPGAMLDKVDVPLHGVNIVQAGRATFSHTLSATFMEAVDWSTRTAFVNWRESIQSWQNNTGSPSAAYKVNASVVVYDMVPSVVKTCQIYGLWPVSIAEVQLNGGETTLVQLTIEFSYDYWLDM